MKPALSVISALLLLSFASGAALAYSGSECEVNDCSGAKPTKANSSATKGQQAKATTAKPATLKEQAKDHAKGKAKEKVEEKLPSQLKGITGFLN